MTKYIIEIKQTLKCYTDIVAESEQEAINIAYHRYVKNSEVLPEMDDTETLAFRNVEVCQKKLSESFNNTN